MIKFLIAFSKRISLIYLFLIILKKVMFPELDIFSLEQYDEELRAERDGKRIADRISQVILAKELGKDSCPPRTLISSLQSQVFLSRFGLPEAYADFLHRRWHSWNSPQSFFPVGFCVQPHRKVAPLFSILAVSAMGCTQYGGNLHLNV